METNVAYLTDPLFYRTLTRDARVLLGMPAIPLEVEATGMPMPLKRALRYGRIVISGRTLVLGHRRGRRVELPPVASST
jgi:hypothetical protein